MSVQFPLDIGQAYSQGDRRFDSDASVCQRCLGFKRAQCVACEGHGAFSTTHIPFWGLIGVDSINCPGCLFTPGFAKCYACNGSGKAKKGPAGIFGGLFPMKMPDLTPVVKEGEDATDETTR
mmetsp:Transcript_6520/g.10127  ORF Transcript_6520/g.10127 Transcript_6520/m.10127 type:complete len:122 (-) Transcript_6520:444-809(-)